MINQSTINIGTIGHVAHGKTTVVKAISGVSTIKWGIELERNITIRLGYANAKIYKCPNCPAPDCYVSKGSKIETQNCPKCGAEMPLIRHISFVDCPGHDVLMATMLNGVAVMDAAILIIAANEKCPQPQTCEHLAAVQMMNLKNIIILQNKIDLVSQNEVLSQYDDILKYTSTTAAKGAPIIPISAQKSYNIKYVIQHIVETIPIPVRDYTSAPKLIVIRSFDINSPGRDVRQLLGGVAGGSIIHGCLKVGEELEVRPGIMENGKCRIRRTKVVSLKAEDNYLQIAVPGGLIGVGTTLDPSLCRADRLTGQVIGRPGTLPTIFNEISIYYQLFKRLVGVVQNRSSESPVITPLKQNEVFLVNVGSTSVGGIVTSLEKPYAVLELQRPVCADIGEHVAISRRIQNSWRLIGWGQILKGKEVPIIEPTD